MSEMVYDDKTQRLIDLLAEVEALASERHTFWNRMTKQTGSMTSAMIDVAYEDVERRARAATRVLLEAVNNPSSQAVFKHALRKR